MVGNSDTAWGSVAKSFHWIIVLLIVGAVPAGFLMSYTYPLALHDPRVLPLHIFAGQIHHTIGFMILGLAVARLAWRLSDRRPSREAAPFPAGAVVRIVHISLYGLLFLIPFSGWAALSVFGQAPIWFFGWSDIMPSILPRPPVTSAFGYGLFARIHLVALGVGAGFVGVHALGALWGHFVTRDAVLLRMWPLARSNRRTP